MITEDFVSFEVAQLLKEKGFDGDGGDCECHMFYSSYSKMIMSITEIGLVSDFDEVYYAPTHQMAMKWLRKEHNILLFLLPAQGDGKLLYLVEVWTWNEEEGIYESTYAPMPRKEPEQAVEAALKYSLENLL